MCEGSTRSRRKTTLLGPAPGRPSCGRRPSHARNSLRLALALAPFQPCSSTLLLLVKAQLLQCCRQQRQQHQQRHRPPRPSPPLLPPPRPEGATRAGSRPPGTAVHPGAPAPGPKNAARPPHPPPAAHRPLLLLLLLHPLLRLMSLLPPPLLLPLLLRLPPSPLLSPPLLLPPPPPRSRPPRGAAPAACCPSSTSAPSSGAASASGARPSSGPAPSPPAFGGEWARVGGNGRMRGGALLVRHTSAASQLGTSLACTLSTSPTKPGDARSRRAKDVSRRSCQRSSLPRRRRATSRTFTS